MVGGWVGGLRQVMASSSMARRGLQWGRRASRVGAAGIKGGGGRNNQRDGRGVAMRVDQREGRREGMAEGGRGLLSGRGGMVALRGITRVAAHVSARRRPGGDRWTQLVWEACLGCCG